VNPHDDPFSGMSLSGDVQPGRLDQRLFAPDKVTARSPQTTPPPKLGDTQLNPSKPPADNSTHIPAPSSPTVGLNPRFDINEAPLYKASFLFTQEELEVMEDLKIELSRRHDKKVTKNNLIRTALHMLVSDYRQDIDRSYVTRVEKNYRNP
jgi:hypothetical protein